MRVSALLSIFALTAVGASYELNERDIGEVQELARRDAMADAYADAYASYYKRATARKGLKSDATTTCAGQQGVCKGSVCRVTVGDPFNRRSLSCGSCKTEGAICYAK
ncbi:unnamed protein product [Clonostachys chloroleuca]|uniref:Uncharacterized protein n=1 Tax=Clonostachys chloroleuca TaxID=1926264 RepID=A0AA35LP46_9HYPO|nr:unnamed protein product [Clonostachys chloroleuca]CAI6015198.1 unnamed protein product [Clonostachys chloroleuca]CAI6089214.1 unnamed protein product [Clonostachys chloroleuca]